jgi:hypothetical protein
MARNNIITGKSAGAGIAKLLKSQPVPEPADDDEPLPGNLPRGAVKEFPFHAERKWRFDWAWPTKRIALEIEGGVWTSGRHTRGKGFEADCEKYAEAAILGWTVIRVTPKMIANGTAASYIRRLLDGVGSKNRRVQDDSTREDVHGKEHRKQNA